VKALRVLLSVLFRLIKRFCDGNWDDASAAFKKIKISKLLHRNRGITSWISPRTTWKYQE